MEIRKNGKLRTEDELREEVIDKLVDALEDLADDDDALNLGNAYREDNHDSPLCVNDEDNINDEWRPKLQAAKGKTSLEIEQTADAYLRAIAEEIINHTKMEELQ